MVLPLSPAFVVHELEGGGLIQLSRTQVRQNVRVTHGRSDVVAYSSNPSVLSIRKVNSMLYSTVFEVNALQAQYDFTENISFNSSSTGQEVRPTLS